MTARMLYAWFVLLAVAAAMVVFHLYPAVQP